MHDLGDFMPKREKRRTLYKNCSQYKTEIGKYTEPSKKFLINYIRAKSRKLFEKW